MTITEMKTAERRVSNESNVDDNNENNNVELSSVTNYEVTKEFCSDDGVQELEVTEVDEYWVFGYGSLVWKVDFPYETKQPGYIKGFLRRFYQNSIDHRGTYEKPGRVVTLVPSENSDDIVYGVAYKIADHQRDEVIKHLDFREKNGYVRHSVTCYPFCMLQKEQGETKNVIKNIVIYVATEDNDSFAGHKNDINDIAKQIFEAHGPSGSNREYVYRLADAMRELFPHHYDDHLYELEKLLKLRESESSVS